MSPRTPVGRAGTLTAMLTVLEGAVHRWEVAELQGSG
jgi:hypothetical protein